MQGTVSKLAEENEKLNQKVKSRTCVGGMHKFISLLSPSHSLSLSIKLYTSCTFAQIQNRMHAAAHALVICDLH